MGKKWIVLLVVLFALLPFSGCKKESDPIDVFHDFASSWESMDCGEMYDLLVLDDQQTLTEEAFSKVYDVFYESLEVAEITVEIEEEMLVEETGSATVPFTLTLSLPQGDISFSSQIQAVLTEEEDWAIDWDYSLVWEGFSAGDNVHKTYDLPERGEIYDRNGSPLAHNGYVVQIGIVPGRLGEMRDEMIAELAETFQLSEKYITDRLALPWVGEDTFVDIATVPMSQLSQVRALYNKNPGITYREVRERVYPYGAAAAHLIGYMGYPNESEISAREPLGFTSDDKVGRTGLEHYLNDRLQGVPGLTLTIRSSEGEDKTVLLEVETIQGENITLNIDASLQQNLYEQMAQDSGTAAVMNYQTGEILALVSTPSYDPNDFILGISSSEYSQLTNDPDKPLFNRFSNLYPPGTAFAPITAAAALDSGTVDVNFAVDIEGISWQEDDSWGSYYISRESEINGLIDMKTAMIYSDAIYFANLSLTMGDSTFLNMARNFGLGRTMALLYPVKTSQLAEEDSIGGDIMLANTGFGQGEVLVNILTLPKAFSAFVNEGETVEPVLIWDENQAPSTMRAISKDAADQILAFLEESVSLPYSTGYGAYIPGKDIAGKTGIALIPASYDSSIQEELGWFVALDQDAETPYVTAMMLEDVKDLGGSSYTVSKVKAFIQSYSN